MNRIALLIISATLAWGADAKAGQAVYEASCASCHGQDGTPSATIAKMMNVKMRDLKSAEVQAQADKDIRKIVLQGKGKMSAISSVSGGEADNVVAFLRTLKH